MFVEITFFIFCTYQDEEKKSLYQNDSVDFSFVINDDKMKKLMKYHPRLYNVSTLPETYYRFFEIGLGFFITNGGDRQYAETYDFRKYGNLIGGASDPTLPQNSSIQRSIQGKVLQTHH